MAVSALAISASASSPFPVLATPTEAVMIRSLSPTGIRWLIELWTRRATTLKPRGHVLDAGSLANLGTPVLADKHQPVAFAVLPNVGRSPAVDTVVITEAARDRLRRAFLIDGRGSRIRTLVLP